MEFRFSNRICLMDAEDALQFVGVPLNVASNGYLRIFKQNHEGERYVHRAIMKAKPGEYVDHINGNKLDNRLNNLRLCTQAQNMANAKMRPDCSSGATGVSWDQRRLKWRAQISANGKALVLGRFDTFDEAVKVRQEAEIKYHGKYSASVGVKAHVKG